MDDNCSEKMHDQDDLYEEDQSSEEMEVFFLENCVKEKVEDLKKFTRQIIVPTEKAFILFTYYRETLYQLTLAHKCHLRISMNKLRISSDIGNDIVDSCHKDLTSKLDSVHYIEINNKEKSPIYFSPHYLQQAKKMKFMFAKFNNILYSHSDKLTEDKLKKNTRQVIIGKRLFQVTIQPSNFKNPQNIKETEKQIFIHIKGFMKKTLSYLQNQFEERKVVVEFDINQKKINCIGERERDVLAVKNTIKNCMESMVIILIRYEECTPAEINKKVEKSQKYSDKIVNYPVWVGNVFKKVICLISKENILRKLFKKQKILAYTKINQVKCQIGMFFIKIYHFREKKAMIDEICSKKGYDLSTFGSIFYYFKKIFKEDNEDEKNTEILELLDEILEGYKDAKERYNVPTRFTSNKFEEQGFQAQNFNSCNGQFYQTGETSIDDQLSNELRRDVMRQKLKMIKSSYVRYQLGQGKERKKVYWQRIIDEKGSQNQTEQGSNSAKFNSKSIKGNPKLERKKYICKQIQPKDFKPKTQYYVGNAKDISENGQETILYFYEGAITVI